jgi:hypothetical protein
VREGVKAVTPLCCVVAGRIAAAALSYTGDICPHHKKQPGRKGEELPFSPSSLKINMEQENEAFVMFCLPHRAMTNYKGEDREAAIIDVLADLGLGARVTSDEGKIAWSSLLILVPWM